MSDNDDTWQIGPDTFTVFTQAGNINIDAKTGGVTFPSGMSLDDAAASFWTAVALHAKRQRELYPPVPPPAPISV